MGAASVDRQWRAHVPGVIGVCEADAIAHLVRRGGGGEQVCGHASFAWHVLKQQLRPFERGLRGLAAVVPPHGARIREGRVGDGPVDRIVADGVDTGVFLAADAAG